MIDYQAHKQQLLDRPKAPATPTPSAEPACAHQWKRFRETILPDRTTEQTVAGMDYHQGPAYFIVKACPLCKVKRRIELVIES